jgi:cob(I)alamin adenosyltransferase
MVRQTVWALVGPDAYNRAVAIYTRAGDAGETRLVDGTRVSKSTPRVEAYGDVDELNSLLGLASASGVDSDLSDRLVAVQRDLFALGARLADPNGRLADGAPKAALGDADVRRLEVWIDQLEAELPPLRRFVVPGGTPAAAALHVARAVCRRAERRIVGLGRAAVEPPLLAYVNRLSDLLFVLARAVNRRAGRADVEW